MESPVVQLSEIVAAAAEPGALAAPCELLALLADEENPVAALSDHDKGNALFAAFNNQFGFINIKRTWRQPYSLEDVDRWVALVRWIAAEFRAWRRADDPKRARLIAVIVAAQSCDWDNTFWSMLWDDLGDGTDLTRAMADFVSGINIHLSTLGGRGPSISQKEEIERFTKADAEGDWATVCNSLTRFAGPMLPSALINQTVRCVNRYGFEELLAAVANLRQTVATNQIAAALSVADRLQLGIASDNPYAQFSCVFQTVFKQRNASELSSPEKQLLADLLTKVAGDADRWRSWMQAFNRLPTWFAPLHVPLGRALAVVPDVAVASYVDAINLSVMTPQTRQCVADCCRSFGQVADLPRRSLLWSRAYERWAGWNFDAAVQGKHLVNIAASELDFAVVGYAVECLDGAQRDARTEAITRQLTVLDDEWHGTFSDCLTSWNRLLSQFQPYAHAVKTIASGEDWLAENRHYYPFDPKEQEYLTMMYRVR